MTDPNASITLKDLYGGEMIKVPGVINADGTIDFGKASRVPRGNQALLVLLNPKGGKSFDIPVTIASDGGVTLGNAPINFPNRAILVVNRTRGLPPLQVDVNVAGSGALTIARTTTFENPVNTPTFSSAEVGNVADTTVVVVFSTQVSSADFTAGVTIEVESVAATIVSATRQTGGSVVHYELDTPVANAEVVTWEYAAASGDIASTSDGTVLGNVTAQAVTNNVEA